MQKIKSGKPRRLENCSVLGEDRAFSFALGNKGNFKPRLPVQNSALLCNSASVSEIISAREVGARNLGCAGNNRPGRCP